MPLLVENKTLAYARAEWKKWIGLSQAGATPFKEVVIELGNHPSLPAAAQTPQHQDHDAFVVMPHSKALYLSGSNPRSVLYAVYAALELLGYSWPRPGEKNARVPHKLKWSALAKPRREEAGFDVRGLAVEGAFDLAGALDSLAWAARHRLNHVHLQFMDLRCFFRRKQPGLDLRTCFEWDQQVFEAAKLCGMRVHRGGHGFLPSLLGLPDYQNWDTYEGPLPRAAQRWAAMLDGNRGFFRGIPANTQVCFSQAGASELLQEILLEYTAAHPGLDVLTLWLGDGVNNTCQCNACRSEGPSQLYLNAALPIARSLARLQPKLKLELIVYTNLLEPPRETMDLPANVQFQFAPWGRSYAHAWGEEATQVASTPLRNESGRFCRWPSNKEYRDFWLAWKKRLPGASWTFFDYYLWPAGFRLYCPHSIPRTFSHDLAWLKQENGCGLMLCQSPVNHWPDGLHPSLQASLLWNPAQDYQNLMQSLIRVEYGDNAGPALDFYEQLEARAALARKTGQKDSAASSLALPRSKALPPHLALYQQFLAFEQGMAERKQTSLKAYQDWLKENQTQISESGDYFDMKSPERFGLPWYEGVGWSRI